MFKKYRGMASLEIVQSMALILFVLLFLLSASLQIGAVIKNAENGLEVQLLANCIVNELDAFQRNACGGGFCHAVLVIPKTPNSSVSFLPNAVTVSNGENIATAHGSLPLGALAINSSNMDGSVRVSASG